MGFTLPEIARTMPKYNYKHKWITLGPRQESRLIVDELNTKVEEARAKGVEDDTTKKRANEATKAKGI